MSLPQIGDRVKFHTVSGYGYKLRMKMTGNIVSVAGDGWVSVEVDVGDGTSFLLKAVEARDLYPDDS